MQHDNKPIFEVGKEYSRRDGGTSLVLKNDVPIGQPMVAIDTVSWSVVRYNADGTYFNGGSPSAYDLIPPPKVISDGWANVYLGVGLSALYSSREKANNNAARHSLGQVHLRILKMPDGKIKVEQVEE